MTVLVACDLDSTLIYSARTAGQDVADLRCVEERNGLPAAFMTHRAARMVDELSHEVGFVPVTTRTVAQLDRVRLPGRMQYRIAANGGVLLNRDAPDEAWAATIEAALSAVAGFAEAMRRAEQICARLGGRTYDIDGLFCLAVVSTLDIPTEVAAAEREWGLRSGWRLSVQGRKAYWVPDALTKSAAVAELARRVGADVVYAAGDSLLDVDLFDIAASGIRPAHGELATLGWSADHVDVTATTGAAAGEEIVAWFAGAVGSAGRGARPAPAPAAAPH